jgi:hypothetical protein
MYRVTLTCSGLSEVEGCGSVADILEEFTHREWHTNTHCEWKQGVLWFSATNDFDKDGLALLDEFGDAVQACINNFEQIHIEVESVLRIDHQRI